MFISVSLQFLVDKKIFSHISLQHSQDIYVFKEQSNIYTRLSSQRDQSSYTMYCGKSDK